MIQSANLDTLWRKSSLRDLYENNFPCVDFNKVQDNHKIICIALLVFIFCRKTSTQNSFVQRTMDRLQLGVTEFYIMGYNLKNARNGKSMSTLAKLLSLRPLALKSKFMWQFEFSENFREFLWEMLFQSKAMLSNNFFHTNLLNCLKIQTVKKYLVL